MTAVAPAPEAASTADSNEPQTSAPSSDAMVEQELLVEDVSIDGMCGVY
jgi:mycofactocin precursor